MDLAVAIENDDRDALHRFLKTRRSAINKRDPGTRMAPLETAVLLGRTEIVTMLLEAGASPTAGAQPPVLVAAQEGHYRICEILIDAGGMDEELAGDVLKAAAVRGDRRLMQHLASRGVRLDKTFRDGETLLHYAVSTSKLDCAELLLSLGASVEALENVNGFTPLMSAARAGEIGSVALLLRFGANVQLTDNHGRTPLHIACEFGSVEAVKELLHAGASVEALDRKGRTPAMLAKQYCNPATAGQILAEVEKVDKPSGAPIDKFQKSSAKATQPDEPVDRSLKGIYTYEANFALLVIESSISLTSENLAALLGGEVITASEGDRIYLRSTAYMCLALSRSQYTYMAGLTEDTFDLSKSLCVAKELSGRLSSRVIVYFNARTANELTYLSASNGLLERAVVCANDEQRRPLASTIQRWFSGEIIEIASFREGVEYVDATLRNDGVWIPPIGSASSASEGSSTLLLPEMPGEVVGLNVVTA